MSEKSRVRLRVKMTMALEVQGTEQERKDKAKVYWKELEAALKKLPGLVLTSKVKLLGWDKPADGKWEAEGPQKEDGD